MARITRYVAALCVVMVLCGVWPLACAAGEATMPLTVRVACVDSMGWPEEGDALLEFIEERFGLTLEPVQTPALDTGNTYRLWAATNNLPDLFTHDSIWDFYYFVNCDALSALPEQLYVYPHLKTLVAYPYARMSLYGGKLWSLPRLLFSEETRAIGAEPNSGGCILMHADVYDALGLVSPPTSLEALAGVLEEARSLFPDMIPMTSHTPEAMFDLVYYEAPQRDTWVWDGARYIPGFLTEAYRDSIARLRPLWQEGLLDGDFMNAAGTPTGLDKFLLRRAAAMIYTTSPHAWLGSLSLRWARLYPDTPLSEGVRMLFLPGDASGEYHVPKAVNTSALYMGANMDAAKQARILSLLDSLYSDEGKTLRRYGMEGEDFTLSESGTPIRLANTQGRSLSLYEKYPSYALLRTLPDLDLGFSSEWAAMDEQVSRLLGEYWAWYGVLETRELHTTSLVCNTISTPGSEGLNPQITHNAFRMLCGQEDVARIFEVIAEEYQAQGIDRIIEEVNWSNLIYH